MVRFSPPEKASAAATSGSPGRPKGIGLGALALSALLALDLVQSLFVLWGGALIGAWSGALSGVLSGALSENGGASPGFQLLQIGLGRGIAGLCIWQYWKGRNWARLLVLLWSFVTLAQALSFLAEHNLDPAALMGRPLSFFEAVLAVILLYWLNTPAVRAWFRKSSATAADLIGDRLRGRLCTAVEFHGSEVQRAAVPFWRLRFEHDAELILRCPWRIVLDNNLAFAYAPADAHAPADGSAAFPVTPAPAAGAASGAAYPTPAEELPPDSVPAPSHSPEEARRLLQNLRVTAVHGATRGLNRFASRSSDLFVSFEMGIELQTWSASAPAAPAPAAGHAPAAGSAALSESPPESPPASALSASPATAPQWRYSDPGLTVIADEGGVKSQVAPAPAEAAGQHADS